MTKYDNLFTTYANLSHSSRLYLVSTIERHPGHSRFNPFKYSRNG